MSRLVRLLLFLGVGLVVVVSLWATIVSSGEPDPTNPQATATVAMIQIAILVLREGLEAILVLAALTANLRGTTGTYRRPIAAGATAAFAASALTWMLAVRILDDLSENVSALAIQAGTGLLAIVVLVIVMNWFFHKVYWTGWISAHTRRREALLQAPAEARTPLSRLWWAFALLGFTAVYREGFEIVLFLQSFRLKLGTGLVMQGMSAGLFFTAIIGALTFVAHRRLPFRQLLVATGVLLGVVLVVMVGEQAQEMQLAQWIPTTELPSLAPLIPAWMGLWFAVFPTLETLVAQALAILLVLGSYIAVRIRTYIVRLRRDATSESAEPEHRLPHPS
ncbi:MAG: FTR1 family protein [Vicinamibacterales bacterium]